MKYELIDESKEFVESVFKIGKIPIFRLKALKDFGDVKVGDLGGTVSGEHNLSQEGNCWIYPGAVVEGDARILDNAIVAKCAKVYDQAVISGNAIVDGQSVVAGDVMVYDNARITQQAKAFDQVQIFGNSSVFGSVHLRGSVKVGGSSYIWGGGMFNGREDFTDELAFFRCEDYKVFGDIGRHLGKALKIPLDRRLSDPDLRDSNRNLMYGE
jgi:hypothetical protein